MMTVITATLQQVGAWAVQFGYCARQTWTLCSALIAVIAGISTLNMVVANLGMATISEFASPLTQQIARFGRQV
jgi:uncharacterized membrane protein